MQTNEETEVENDIWSESETEEDEDATDEEHQQIEARVSDFYIYYKIISRNLKISSSKRSNTGKDPNEWATI